MKKFYILIILMFSFLSKNLSANEKLAYEFSFNKIDGGVIELSNYKNKTLLIVNVASRCGFTKQYEGLQKIWSLYKDRGLVVIGIPSDNFNQEPGTNKEIKNFCETTFGINFPITEKMNIIGNDAHPFFQWAKDTYGIGAVPKWNFHKIIVNKKGKVSETFSSLTKPSSKKFINIIEKELKT